MVVVFLDLDGVVLPIANSDDTIYKHASETTYIHIVIVVINPSGASETTHIRRYCYRINQSVRLKQNILLNYGCFCVF